VASEVITKKSYWVFGSSRDAQMASFGNLKKLGFYE
jgi:hypothetical protein